MHLRSTILINVSYSFDVYTLLHPFPSHRCGQSFYRVLFGFHTGSWGVGPRRWSRHMYSFFIIPTWPFSTPCFGSVLIIASLSRVLAPRGARRLCAVLALDGYLVLYGVLLVFVDPVSFQMALHCGGRAAVLVGSSLVQIKRPGVRSSICTARAGWPPTSRRSTCVG